MPCTNPNCECKAGSYANLNPPHRADAMEAMEFSNAYVANGNAARAKRITPSDKTVYRVEIAGMDITLRKRSNNSFTVVYGKQVHNGLTYANAAKELGECIMHALALEGKLD